MILRTNPVLAEMEVRLYGRRGGTKYLHHARKIKFRPRGRKDLPWTDIDVSKLRKNIDKETILYDKIVEVRIASDKLASKTRKAAEKAEKKRVKTLKRAKGTQKHSDIKFNRPKTREQAVKSKTGKVARYKIYAFELKKLLKFVSGTKTPDVTQIDEFMRAVSDKAKEIFRKHGKTWYFIRTTHRYSGLKAQKKKGREIKFDGLAAPRFHADSLSDMETMVNEIRNLYFTKMLTYLKHASNATSFDFLGFTIEVTLPKKLK